MTKRLIFGVILLTFSHYLYGQGSSVDKALDSILIRFLINNKQIEYRNDISGGLTDSEKVYNDSVLLLGNGYRIMEFQSFASHSEKHLIIYQHKAVYRILSGKNLEEEFGYMIAFFKKHGITNRIDCYEALLECYKHNMEQGIKTALIPER